MINPEKTLGKFIDKDPDRFLAYDEDDEVVSPLASVKLDLLKRNGLKELWFSTNISSARIEFFKQNRNASLYALHKSFSKGVELTGTIDILEISDPDSSVLQQTPTPLFPCVLKFTATKARYYTQFKNEYFNIP